MRPGRSALFAGLVPVLVGGCYQYSSYATDRPAPATVVELTLNDRGRVAMEHHIGPEIMTVEGTVASATDSIFTLQVSRVTTLDRHFQRWAGEPVTFRTEHVRMIRERRFSAGRTVLFAGSVAASAVAFAATGLLIGSALGDRSEPGGPGGGSAGN